MIAPQRTYRFVAALMVVLLLTGGSLPLIQHACAMMGARTTLADRCCCDDSLPRPGGEQPVPQHTGHYSPATPAPGTPCHEAVSAPEPDVHEGDDCCTVEITRTVPEETTLPNRAPALQSAITLLFVADVPADHPAPQVHTSFLDTGPPPVSVCPLHLLHGSFLN